MIRDDDHAAVSLKKDVDELVHAAFAVTCDAGAERLFAEAVSYFSSDRPNKTAKIKCLFYRTIVTVTDILSTPEVLSPSAKRLLPAMARIKTGFADPALRIDEFARLAGLSKKHFTGEFVSVYGDTPGRFILSLRIDMACRLLTRTGLPVREVAERCGFGSEYYFSRIFSAKTGYPPTVYRKKLPKRIKNERVCAFAQIRLTFPTVGGTALSRAGTQKRPLRADMLANGLAGGRASFRDGSYFSYQKNENKPRSDLKYQTNDGIIFTLGRSGRSGMSATAASMGTAKGDAFA